MADEIPVRHAIEIRLTRVVTVVSSWFKKKPQPDRQLHGRLEELQHNINQVLDLLKKFKSGVKEKCETNLFKMINGIIDPIIRDIERAQMRFVEGERTVLQVKTVRHYGELLDKARIWIHLAKQQQYDKNSLHEAIIHYTICEFNMRIERDIQVLWDYLDNSLDSQHITHETKDILKASLEPKLTSFTTELEKLKLNPTNTSLDRFNSWKVDANNFREKIFSDALHVIDEFANEFIPQPPKENESTHSMAILEDLSLLEENVGLLTRAVLNEQNKDVKYKKKYNSTLDRLEAHTNDLNSNLHLSQDQMDRVQKTLDNLSTLRKKIID